MNPVWDIRQGHVIEQLRAMPAESVHCVVSSPPYWALRSYGHWHMQKLWSDKPLAHFPESRRYGGALHFFWLKWRAAERGGVFCRYRCCWIGSLGLEPTLEMYVDHMVEVAREVWRVLRPDGTLWLNLGDAYMSQPSNGRGGGSTLSGGTPHLSGSPRSGIRLKPKDLMGMPWRIAFALQAEGWWLRSDIVWSKPNPMPESVKDRPTRAHEYVFLLTKSERYYYDHVAIREPMAESSLVRISQPSFWEQHGGPKDYGTSGVNPSRSGRRALENFAAKRTPVGWNVNHDESDLRGRYPQRRAPGRSEQLAEVDAEFKHEKRRGHPRSHEGNLDEGTKADQQASGANRRDVWHIATQPFPGAHFATFPVALVEPCILAGTSAHGVCAECGAPWERITKRNSEYKEWAKTQRFYGEGGEGTAFRKQGTNSATVPISQTTIGWQTSCAHEAGPVPSVVLDPFCGSGTTGVVALRHGRSFVGIELNAEYIELARERIVNDAPLLNRNGDTQ